MKAHVATSQFGPAAAKLLLPVGSERDRRMATADGVLPAVQKLSPLLRKIAPEIYCSHGLFTPIITNKGRGHLSLAGTATALLAAIPGVIDYLYTVPPDSSGKARATKHMLANLTAVALFGAAWWLRGGAATRPDAIVLSLEVIGLGLLGAGGYMGAHWSRAI